MIPLTALAHAIVREHVDAGAIVVDATAGNGYDTLFLAELVGDAGKVYALDVQPEAIASTASRLPPERRDRVELLLADHSALSDLIPSSEQGQVQAVMFNLGYLPGGEKSKTTRLESTAPALESAWEMLAEGGVLSVMAYPGHPGGAEEAEGVEQFVTELSRRGMHPEAHRGSGDRMRSPVLHVVKKR